MRTEHQKHAARCRHAAATQAKLIYCEELTLHFGAYRTYMPVGERMKAFMSSRRQKIHDYAEKFGFKESTFRTWLREWKVANAFGL